MPIRGRIAGSFLLGKAICRSYVRRCFLVWTGELLIHSIGTIRSLLEPNRSPAIGREAPETGLFVGVATSKATVKAVAPGAGTPAGTVTFSEGEAVLGVVQLAGINATLPLKTLPPGTHEITAAYSGDADYEPSEAAPVVQTILKATTETSLTSTLNPAPYGSSASLKATVKAVAPGGGTPQGTVSFRAGETLLATVPLASGSAKYALKSLPAGTHEIIASYGGSDNYEASEASIAQVISP